MFHTKVVAVAIALMVCCAPAAGSAAAAGGDCARARELPREASLELAVAPVMCLVNGERAERGLAPLRASRTLARSARAHSLDMVQRRYFSHISPGGATVCERVRRMGYRAGGCRVGETIAWGTGKRSTPAELVRSFMNSAGHRRILLERRYREVGVGLALGAPVDGVGDGDGATLTLDFGRRR